MHARSTSPLALETGPGSPTARIFRLDATDAIPVSGTRTDDKGQPVRSFNKAILRAGAIVRNTAGAVLTITTEYLDSIAATFAKMKAAGIATPIQLGHNFDADKTRGIVTDVWRDGDLLQSRVDLVGDDGIRLASVTDVSVYVEPSHERNGTVYTDALLHVACTPAPQVTGLGAFVPIPAALAASVFETAKEPTMNWKTLAASLGLDASQFDDTTGPAAVEAAVRSAVADKTALAASLTAKAAEIGTLQLSVGRLTAEKGGLPQIDQGLLDEHAEIVTGRMDALVASRHMTPAQKTDLSAVLLGEKGKRPALCLSATAASAVGLPASLGKLILDIFAKGTPAGKVGSQTGAQGAPGNADDLSADDRTAFRAGVAAAAA